MVQTETHLCPPPKKNIRIFFSPKWVHVMTFSPRAAPNLLASGAVTQLSPPPLQMPPPLYLVTGQSLSPPTLFPALPEFRKKDGSKEEVQTGREVSDALAHLSTAPRCAPLSLESREKGGEKVEEDTVGQQVGEVRQATPCARLEGAAKMGDQDGGNGRRSSSTSVVTATSVPSSMRAEPPPPPPHPKVTL